MVDDGTVWPGLVSVWDNGMTHCQHDEELTSHFRASTSTLDQHYQILDTVRGRGDL